MGYTVVKERFSAEKSGVAIGAVNAIAFVGPALVPTAMGAALDAYWTGETIAGARVHTQLGYLVAFGLTVSSQSSASAVRCGSTARSAGRSSCASPRRR